MLAAGSLECLKLSTALGWEVSLPQEHESPAAQADAQEPVPRAGAVRTKPGMCHSTRGPCLCTGKGRTASERD